MTFFVSVYAFTASHFRMSRPHLHSSVHSSEENVISWSVHLLLNNVRKMGLNRAANSQRRTSGDTANNTTPIPRNQSPFARVFHEKRQATPLRISSIGTIQPSVARGGDRRGKSSRYASANSSKVKSNLTWIIGSSLLRLRLALATLTLFRIGPENPVPTTSQFPDR